MVVENIPSAGEDLKSATFIFLASGEWKVVYYSLKDKVEVANLNAVRIIGPAYLLPNHPPS